MKKMGVNVKKLISFLLAGLILVSVLSSCGKTPEQVGKAGIIIYEVYTGGGYSSGENYAPYAKSYAVLYNPTDKDVSLEGWSLLYAEANTGKYVKDTAVALKGTIGADKFYVVEGGLCADAHEFIVGEPLPFDVDASGDKFRPNLKEGIIALYNSSVKKLTAVKPSDAAAEDFLAYSDEGKATLFSGSGSVNGNGISVKKILRRSSLVSSGDNAVDFATKNIFEKPAQIIFYKKDLTGAVVAARPEFTETSVTFSQGSGYYKNEFNLTLSTNLENAKIYYTVDGSNPVSQLGTLSPTAIEYTKPVRVYDRTSERGELIDIKTVIPASHEGGTLNWPDPQKDGESQADFEKRIDDLYRSIYKFTVIKAAAVDANKVATPVIANSYIVSQKDIAARYNMPLISIVTDKSTFDDEKTGLFLYENLQDRGEVSERSCFVQYFNTKNELIFAQNAGLRIHGNYTRIWPQKGFRINLSDKDFSYDLFDGRAKDDSGKVITYFDKFVLRNGGNDWLQGGIRDVFWQSFCSSLGTVDFQAYKSCVVFLNGEYFGIYQMNENQDDYYLESHHNIPREYACIVDEFKSVKEGTDADLKALVELQKYIIEKDLRVAANYDHVKNELDIDKYIDYIICEVYGGNLDWPLNNIRFYRNNDPNAADKRWKPLLCDCDQVFTPGTENGTTMKRILLMEELSAKMFQGLMKNPTFKKKFIERFRYLLDNFFVNDDILKHLESFYKEREVAQPEYLARWSRYLNDYKATLSTVQKFLVGRNDNFKTELDELENQ